jgi:hypothetical protein
MLAVVTLLAVSGGAETFGYSETVSVDTRSYTVNWSAAGTLNTKLIMGTVLRFM